MTRPKPELLCRYHYDPIDRLAGCSPLGQHDTHCFYHLNRLSTEIQGAVQTSWLQTPDLLLAQERLEARYRKGALLATEAAGSVVHVLSDEQQQGFAYLPYGVRHPLRASLSLPGFNGERLDPVTGHYLLGNGYRAFNPVLMRFNSPDSLSPFGKGGVNAYAYCHSDPINHVDPSGHMLGKLSRFLQGARRSSDETVTFSVGGDPGIVRTARQSITYNTEHVSEMPEARKLLQHKLGPDELATPFGNRLDAVNTNLASHGDTHLGVQHAEYYASLAQKVATGEVTNATAHARSSWKWLSQAFAGPHPRAAITGFVFNAAASMTTAAAEAGALKTGAALKGGLTSNLETHATRIRK